MSSFKKLNKADVTTVSYAANKRWSFPNNSGGITDTNTEYVVGAFGINEPFDINGTTTINGQYRSLVYAEINHLFYQSYTSSLDTGSLMFNINTYESASSQRPTSSYFNYNINPLLIKQFPSGAGDTIGVLSINQDIYGSKILPTSFQISGSSIIIKDDGYGNLFEVSDYEDDYIDLNYISQSYFNDSTPGVGITFVGNIFYAHGIVVLNSYTNLIYEGGEGSSSIISFQNEHIIYENEVRCIVKESEYNLSYNPTLVSGSYESGSLYDFAQGIKSTLNFDYTRVTASVAFSTISGSAGGGTRIIVDNGSNGSPTASLANSIGFNFGFYGPTYSSCNIMSDGTIQFNTAINDNNQPIPTPLLGPTMFPNNICCGNEGYFNSSHGVWTKLTGTAGSRIFTVEWKFDNSGFGDCNFQAKLYEGTNVIEFIYNYFTYGGPPFIGLQNTYFQYDVYTNSYTGQPSVPPPNTKIVYTPTSSTYISGSFDFYPYATTIGLYNDDNDLLMVAKLGKPIMISPDTDMCFVVKYDT